MQVAETTFSNSRSDWFNEARFGMFVHWGPYSVAGRGEWVMNREHIDHDSYIDKYVRSWSALNYDPGEWASVAKAAGMKYVVLTTRHHDGFALWETKTTPCNAAKMGPRRDLVKPFVEAVRAAGLKVGLYYSVADWSHPDYPGAHYRDWPESNDWKDDAARERFIVYYQEQVRELMTGYGKIDILWYDGCMPGPLEGEQCNSMVRALQPDILINERNGGPFDFRISEQAIKPKEGFWESCITLNRNWGWHSGDNHWKPSTEVLELLIQAASGGGNLLVNVGPMADGKLPEKSVEILVDCGLWLNFNRESISNSERHGFTWNNTCLVTQINDRVFLHFINQPGKDFCWSELRNRVTGVRMLSTGTPVKWEQKDGQLHLSDLPVPLSNHPITTVEVQVEGRPEPVAEQKNFWIPG